MAHHPPVLILASTLVGALALGSLAPAAMQAPGQGRGGPGPAGGRGLLPRDASEASRLGTAAIAGTVLTDGTGFPVRRARVTLNGAELQGGRSTLSDDQGQFTFVALPAGRFTLTASKAGFVDASYGAKRPGRPGTPIQLADGQKVERVVLSMPRGGVVTGVVVDESGDPSPGTQVRAYRYVMRTGERSLVQAGQDQTDDRGIYRIFQLPPGEYVISAVPRNMAIGDLRESLSSEVASLLQQAGTRGGGPAGGVAAFGGRGAQAILARANELQQQLANMEQDQTSAYAPVYYPGTTSPGSATALTLNAGEERAGVDFRLQLVPTAQIDGVVVMPDGSALPPTTTVSLVSADRAGLPSIPGISANTTRPTGTGQFSFRSVTPGQYVVQARANVFRTGEAGTAGATQPPGRGRPFGPGGAISQVLWASMDVYVSGQNASGLMLALQPGMTVSGRLDFQGNTPPPADLTRTRVSLTARGPQVIEIGGVPPAEVDASGRFRIAGVPPGRYVFTANIASGGGPGRTAGPGRGAGGGTPSSAGWVLKSALVNGADVLDMPLEIAPGAEIANAVLTFSDRTQELSGTIQDVSGRPTADFTIIVFPADRRYWGPQSRRIVSTRPGTDGRFSLRGLPVGDYRLTAVTDVEPGEWYDPAFLEQLAPVSLPISLAEGETKVQDIKVAGG